MNHFAMAMPSLLTTLPLPNLHSLPYYVVALGLLPLAFSTYRLVLQDYHFFLSLGPGGTPSTPAGYLRICLLRLIARSDVLVPPTPLGESSSSLNPFFASPHRIPSRKAARPQVGGIAPHRQTTQRSTHAEVMALRRAMIALKEHNPGLLRTGKSCFEKHSLALFWSPAGAPTPRFVPPEPASSAYLRETDTYRGPGARNATCGTPPEIAHLHGSDGSLHLTLHPADAKLVIEKGWGERHPLAGRGSFVPKGFMLIYAPRRPEELEVVADIVRAGGWWVGGAEIQA